MRCCAFAILPLVLALVVAVVLAAFVFRGLITWLLHDGSLHTVSVSLVVVTVVVVAVVVAVAVAVHDLR